MNIITIGLLICVLAVQGEIPAQNIVDSDQEDTQCADYCYQVTKPLMDHTKVLYTQGEDSHASNTLDKMEELIQTKLKNLKTEVGSTLQKQFINNAKINGDILSRFEKIEAKLKKVTENVQSNPQGIGDTTKST